MAYSCLFVLKQASSKNKNLSFQVHTLMLIKCLLINILNNWYLFYLSISDHFNFWFIWVFISRATDVRRRYTFNHSSVWEQVYAMHSFL